MHAAGQQMRGAPWLHLSSLGIGTYLGDADAATDAQASRVPPREVVFLFRARQAIETGYYVGG